MIFDLRRYFPARHRSVILRQTFMTARHSSDFFTTSSKRNAVLAENTYRPKKARHQKHGYGPTALFPDHGKRRLVNRADVRPFPPIGLDIDQNR